MREFLPVKIEKKTNRERNREEEKEGEKEKSRLRKDLLTDIIYCFLEIDGNIFNTRILDWYTFICVKFLKMIWTGV